MIQTIIVVTIVVLAVAYIVSRGRKTLKGNAGCGCGCSGCGTKSSNASNECCSEADKASGDGPRD
jgi:predicted RNA methylase